MSALHQPRQSCPGRNPSAHPTTRPAVAGRRHRYIVGGAHRQPPPVDSQLQHIRSAGLVEAVTDQQTGRHTVAAPVGRSTVPPPGHVVHPIACAYVPPPHTSHTPGSSSTARIASSTVANSTSNPAVGWVAAQPAPVSY